MLVAAGLTPFEALQTATVNPARFFAAGERFGSIGEGMEADLLVVEANPLEDISNLSRLGGVMLRGRWLSRDYLDTTLAALAR